MAEKRRWSEDDDGNESMMRIGAMWAIRMGVLVVVVGLVLAVYEVITQPIRIVAGLALVGVGSGLITGALTNKAWQARSESQWQTPPAQQSEQGGGAR